MDILLFVGERASRAPRASRTVTNLSVAYELSVVEFQDLVHPDSRGDEIGSGLVDRIDLDYELLVLGRDKVFLAQVLASENLCVLESEVGEEFGKGQARHVVYNHVLGSEEQLVLGTEALVDDLGPFGLGNAQGLEDHVVGQDVALAGEGGGH